MKIRTNVKAGALSANHNETQVRDTNAAGSRVKMRIRAGALSADLCRIGVLACLFAVGMGYATKVDDEIYRDTKTLVSTATDLAGDYTSGKSAFDVGVQLLQRLGWVKSDPSAAEQFAAVQRRMNEGFAGVIWWITSDRLRDLSTNMKTAMDELRYGVQIVANDNAEWASGWTLNYLTGGDPSTIPVFYRQYLDHGRDNDLLNLLNKNAGSSAGFYTQADFDPISINSDPAGNAKTTFVYDWRLGVPVLMTAIAYRLQIIASMDPNFRTNGKFKDDFNQWRTALKWHYNMMLKGIKCGPYSYVCVDLHSGMYQFPNYGGAPVPPSGLLGVYAVRAAMPLYEVKAMIDKLYIYANPAAADLTETYHRLPSWHDPASCLDITDRLTKPGAWPISNLCNGTTSQQWIYDRMTGTVRNSGTLMKLASGRCLGLTGGVDPLAVGVLDCSGDRGQQWTYDPEQRTLLNAMGTALTIQWGSFNAPPDHLAAYRVSAAALAPGQQWQADQTPEIVGWGIAGMKPFSGTLQPGETLYKGQSRVSRNNRYELILQNDGNLVLYEKVSSLGLERFVVRWASDTDGKAVSGVVMQGDGNLVIYSPPGTCSPRQTCNGPFLTGSSPVWASNTNGHPGSELLVQDSGNAVIYQQTATIPKQTIRIWATD